MTSQRRLTRHKSRQDKEFIDHIIAPQKVCEGDKFVVRVSLTEEGVRYWERVTVANKLGRWDAERQQIVFICDTDMIDDDNRLYIDDGKREICKHIKVGGK